MPFIKEGGGIKILYCKGNSEEVIGDFSVVLDSCESLFIEQVYLFFGIITVCCIHRPLSHSADEFCSFAGPLLDSCDNSRTLAVAGFNLNVVNYNESSQVKSYFDLFT